MSNLRSTMAKRKFISLFNNLIKYLFNDKFIK